MAIIGLGGLGHMAVKIAHAMKAEVTVLTRTLNKKDDAIRLGADHVYATNDPKTFEKLSFHFDLIINTVSVKLDWGAYLGSGVLKKLKRCWIFAVSIILLQISN